MAYQDPRGVTLNAASNQSIDRFEQVLDDYLSLCNDPEAILNEILADDPNFIMGHCFKAALNLLAMERSTRTIVATAIENLDRLARNANELERHHIAAIKTWYAGNLHGAVAEWEHALLINPRDIVAVRLCHDLAFLLADCRNLRDSVGRIRREWDESVPGYGYLLGMHSFGLEECGDYDRALDDGYKALEINRKDSWAVHALAHVYEMQGRQSDGIEFMTSRERDWAPNNFFAIHNWWHLTMYHLDLQQYEHVLELYDGPIRKGKSNAILDLVDGASMLWRLYLLGKDAGTDRWNEITETWMNYSRDGIYAFNDLHVMMGLAATGRYGEAEELIKLMEGVAAGPDCTNKLAVITLGLPACRGLYAFGKGNYREAIEQLLPVRNKAFHFGGSHAQRDLLSWTTIEAMLRDGQYDQARAITNERIELKPTSPQSQLMAARASEGLKLPARANEFRLRASNLMSAA